MTTAQNIFLTEEVWLREMENAQSFLLSYAWKLTRNREDAHDLVQDTKVNAWRSRATFEDIGENSFKRWTVFILKNLFITSYRKRKKSFQTVSIDGGEITYSMLNSFENGDFAWINEVTGQNHVLSFIAKAVPQPDFLVPFLLVHLHEYTYKEVAEIIGVSEGTIKSRVHRAKKFAEIAAKKDPQLFNI